MEDILYQVFYILCGLMVEDNFCLVGHISCVLREANILHGEDENLVVGDHGSVWVEDIPFHAYCISYVVKVEYILCLVGHILCGVKEVSICHGEDDNLVTGDHVQLLVEDILYLVHCIFYMMKVEYILVKEGDNQLVVEHILVSEVGILCLVNHTPYGQMEVNILQ